ncbi:MAG: hypothetical protein KDJ38_03850, partial [Gammaproteobacteria bacterium]|nr:hypothetical protein [Gammaproteobacteria bacterium]
MSHLSPSRQDFSRPRLSGRGKAFLNDEARPRLNHLQTWQLSLVGVLLAVFYGTIPLELSASLQVYYLFCLAGLVIAIGRRPLLPFNETEKTGILIILVFFLVSLITFWINGMPGKGDIYVEGRYGKYLLAIPVYFFFREFYIPNRLIFMIATLVAIQLAVIALIDVFSPGVFDWPGRASANTHPIYFAMLSLGMAVIILAFRDEW